MGIRKKKTVRDQLEVRLDDFLNQAEDLRKQVSDRAPEVRDNLITPHRRGSRRAEGAVARDP